MRLTFEPVDLDKADDPIRWVGRVQAVEDTKRKDGRSLKRKEFCQQTAFRRSVLPRASSYTHTHTQ